MSAHIITGPAGSGKTAHLIERFRTLVRAQPGSVWWLVPSPGAAEPLRERLLDAGGLFGFRVGPFADLVKEILVRGQVRGRLLAATPRRLLLEEIVADLRDEGQLSRFDRVCETR